MKNVYIYVSQIVFKEDMSNLPQFEINTVLKMVILLKILSRVSNIQLRLNLVLSYV